MLRASRIAQTFAQIAAKFRRRIKSYDTEPVRQEQGDYQARLQRELENFRSVVNVHDLPDIFHYWSNKYLVPKFQMFGFGNPREFYLMYMTQVCGRPTGRSHFFASIGSGNCEFEVQLAEDLIQKGHANFQLECLDINPDMLDRGKELAGTKGVSEKMTFLRADINAWEPGHDYEVIMANQSLHHFLELETLFTKIQEFLTSDGFFLTDDMIGRNGHMRWPEALDIVRSLWKELPNRYKYNHQLKRLEEEFQNWDCSTEGFEGIRAQDILPLLIERFHFDLFVGFANVIDVFIDRSFGHNFDPNSKWDLEFIDRVHAIDEDGLEEGIIKPTHMTAAWTKWHNPRPKVYKHLTPAYCLRNP